MPDPVSDNELIGRCLRRDEAAWRELIHRYRRLIYSIPVAYRFADPDEIFQTVAVKLFRNLGKLKKRESLGAWITITARRECLAAKKRQQRSQPLEDHPEVEFAQDPPDVAQALHDLECEHTLLTAMEKLDALCRALLRALYVEDPTPPYKEVAERLQRPIGSLGPTRGRCLGKLREYYEELGGKPR